MIIDILLGKKNTTQSQFYIARTTSTLRGLSFILFILLLSLATYSYTGLARVYNTNYAFFGWVQAVTLITIISLAPIMIVAMIKENHFSNGWLDKLIIASKYFSMLIVALTLFTILSEINRLIVLNGNHWEILPYIIYENSLTLFFTTPYFILKVVESIESKSREMNNQSKGA